MHGMCGEKGSAHASLYCTFSQVLYASVTRNKHENINVDYKIIEVITSKHKPRKNKNVETKKCRITKMSNTKMSKINLQVHNCFLRTFPKIEMV